MTIVTYYKRAKVSLHSLGYTQIKAKRKKKKKKKTQRLQTLGAIILPSKGISFLPCKFLIAISSPLSKWLIYLHSQEF